MNEPINQIITFKFERIIAMKLKTLSTLILCAASMQAVANDKAYWTGSDGDYARATDGKCVRTDLWTEDKSIAGCEGRVEKTAAVEPAEVTATKTTTPVAKTVVATVVATSEQATSSQANQSRNANTNFDQTRQDRIAALKAEQKQRRSEMFARINAREAQHLEKYKAGQDQHIERLRAQIAKQEQMIEKQELRNKASLEAREARIQSSQSNREQILNRI